jgi:NADH-ubiquinone oxidoreductase chain 1
LFYAFGLIFFFCCTVVSVYTLMGSGWSSNSSYALLGSLRGVAQAISYEVRMILIILSFVCLTGSYDLGEFKESQTVMRFLVAAGIISFLLIISFVAETNRSPFDFAEGESELVSGFNVEYGGGGFAIIFLSEYSSIGFMGVLAVVILVGLNSLFALLLLGRFLSFTIIWIRGAFPRYRYDMLISLA